VHSSISTPSLLHPEEQYNRTNEEHCTYADHYVNTVA
jgi:hypothetical protein